MAYLQITLKVSEQNRGSAANVYAKYKEAFLKGVKGARTKELLVSDEDVQVLHGFDSAENAQAYLKTDLFNNDVVVGLKPFLDGAPEVRIYSVA